MTVTFEQLQNELTRIRELISLQETKHIAMITALAEEIRQLRKELR